MHDADHPPYNHRRIEYSVLKRWQEDLIPQKVAKLNEHGEPFFYLDGPPYTTGSVHVGIAYNKILKDIMLRYKRMQRFNVIDKPGFDMHGLPIEILVEKEVKINPGQMSEKDLEHFINSCRTLSRENLSLMSKEFMKLGVWMDWENPYLTASPSYIESIWWSLKKAYESGSLISTKQIVPWCPRCQTALGDHEIVTRRQKVNVACIKIPLKNRQDEFILVWTTQPWTLPAAVAVGVSHDGIYQKIEVHGEEGREVLITLKNTADEILQRAGLSKKGVLAEVTGTELSGEEIIHPLLTEVQIQRNLQETWVHKVIAHDYVRHSRTGAIYIAPGVCPQDFDISLEFKLPVLIPLTKDGKFAPDFSAKYGGFDASEVNSLVIRDVRAGGLMLFENDEIRKVKCCWRCGSPVTYRLDTEWFLKTVQIKPRMLNEIKTINWYPTDFGNTKMKAWIEKAGDWCISKRRYWGIPIPFWKCQKEGCDGSLFVGSLKELQNANGYRQGMPIHVPDIDNLTFSCPKCKSTMLRTPQVADVWLDAAGASWASLGYPQSEELFKKYWPANVIMEGNDQVKGWFYSQMALSLLVHGRAPYVQAVAHGLIQESTRKKISKSQEKSINAMSLRDQYGSDAERVGLMLHGPIVENHIFNPDLMRKAMKTLAALWHGYNFMQTWMKRCEFSPDVVTFESISADLTPEDRWILSRLEGTKLRMKEGFDTYRYDLAASALVEFVDDLSKIYLPAIKWRVKTEEETHDKMVALRVLYDLYSGISQASAPLIPFLAEEIHSGLEKESQSVFLMEYPEINRSLIDPGIEEMMKMALAICTVVNTARREAGIGRRWPLNKIVVKPANEDVANGIKGFSNLIAQYANVQVVEVLPFGQEWDMMVVEVRPNPNAIGRVYRQWASKIGAMLKFQSAKKIREGIEKGEYMIGIEGQMIRILPEMVEFVSRLPDGVIEKQCDCGKIYIDLNITPNIRKLGMAREIIRRIQEMRKEMKLSYGDYIECYIMASPSLRTMIEDIQPIIREITYSQDVKFTEAPAGDYIVEWTVLDESITIGIKPLHFDRVLRAFMRLPGINLKRAKALFHAGFTTPESLHTATIEKLESIPDIGRSAARKIRRFIETLEKEGRRLTFEEEKSEDISAKIEEVSVQIMTEMEQEQGEPQHVTPDEAGTRVASARESSEVGISTSEQRVNVDFSAELAEVPGVGPSKAQMLIDAGYTDLERLADANIDELASLPRIGKALAKVIISWAKEEEIKRGLKKEASKPVEEEKVKGTPSERPESGVQTQSLQGGSPASEVQGEAQVEGEIHEDIISAVEGIIGESGTPPVVARIDQIERGKIYLYEKEREYDAIQAFAEFILKYKAVLMITTLASQVVMRFIPPRIIAQIAAGYKKEGEMIDFRLFYLSDKWESDTYIRINDIDRVVSVVEQFSSECGGEGIIMIDGIDGVLRRTGVDGITRMIACLRGCTGGSPVMIGIDKKDINEQDLYAVERCCDFIVRR